MDLAALVDKTVGALFEQLITASESTRDDIDDRVSPVVVRMDKEVDAYSLILRNVQDRVSTCRTRRNTFALINRLPKDIMFVIFNLAMEGSKPSNAYYTKLCTLRFVCKAWDAFIRQQSSFWAFAFLDLPDELQELTVTRSRNHPLAIQYPSLSARGRGYGRGSPRRERCDRFLTRAIAEHWPIKSLSFTEYHSHIPEAEERPIATLLSAPAPLLETLSLNIRHPINNIFGGVAPVLRDVVLERSELGAGFPALSNLRSLELRDVRGLAGEQFLQLLSQSPNIEEVVVRSQQFRPEAHTDPDAPRFALNRLHTLKLHQVTSKSILSVLNSIATPPTTELSLHPIWYGDGLLEDPDLSQLIETVVNRYPAEKILFGYRFSQALKIKGERWNILAEVLEAAWEDENDPAAYAHFFQRMIPSGVRAQVTAVEIVGNDTMDLFIPALDVAFPAMKELEFELQGYAMDFNLNPLGQTVGAGTENHRWMCPQLQDLTLVQADLALHTLEAVRLMAQTRSQPGAGGLAPSPLQSFFWKPSGKVTASPEALAALRGIKTFVPKVTARDREPNDAEWMMWPHTGGWDSDMEWQDQGDFGWD